MSKTPRTINVAAIDFFIAGFMGDGVRIVKAKCSNAVQESSEDPLGMEGVKHWGWVGGEEASNSKIQTPS